MGSSQWGLVLAIRKKTTALCLSPRAAGGDRWQPVLIGAGRLFSIPRTIVEAILVILPSAHQVEYLVDQV